MLLLDEPTNDLDVDTLRTLEEALLSFPDSAIPIKCHANASTRRRTRLSFNCLAAAELVNIADLPLRIAGGQYGGVRAERE